MDLNKELAKKARFDEKDRWIYRLAFLSQFMTLIKKMSESFLNINVIKPHQQYQHLDKVRELSDPNRKFKRFHTKGRN
jgi:hypothetical protein